MTQDSIPDPRDYNVPPMPAGPNLIAISIGNTRSHLGQFAEGKLTRTEHFANEDASAMIETVLAWWQGGGDPGPSSLVLATVDDALADRLSSALEDQLSVEVYRIGVDVPIPIAVQLDPETITGVDRLLNAAACYERVQQACVIIDAGTAVTVDFVDGEGTFHGGAIAPGARMQLRALHEQTASLPEIDFHRPEPEAFGRSTTQAMLQGVYHGIRGMIWRLVEQYAERYGAYPMVIATGGDAKLLFDNDELIDRIVPDLTLMGIEAAVRQALTTDGDG